MIEFCLCESRLEPRFDSHWSHTTISCLAVALRPSPFAQCPAHSATYLTVRLSSMDHSQGYQRNPISDLLQFGSGITGIG